MKKIYLMMGVAALALSSCSQEDVLDTNTVKADGDAISFRMRSKKTSRSMEFSTYNLDEFMVYGFKGCPDDGEEVTDYFGEVVKFTRKADDVIFTSEKPYYYPTDGSWLYFAAYAPASLEFTATDEKGGLILDDFTVNADITKQIDIICANGGSNLTPDMSDQELTFKHALTKVYVSAVSNNDNDYTYEIIGVKFANIDVTGNFEFNSARTYAEGNEDLVNEVFRPDGFIADGDGQRLWKPAGDQTHEIVYLFDEPIVLDAETTQADLMSGDDTEAGENGGAGCFMMIPQQLSNASLNADGNLEGLDFEADMSYAAFLVRITYHGYDEEDGETPKDFLVYPYAEGMGTAAQTVGGVEYGWAAFPLSSLWVPGKYIDYFVDFTKGAGFVAPGADERFVLKPIFSREIKFFEEVGDWESGSWTTIDQNNELGMDVTDQEDPFGAPRK